MTGYELEAVIGKGSTSTVYRARRRGGDGQVVALKRLRSAGRPEVVQRLREEAGALAALDHPHLVRVLEVVPDGAGAAMAMEHAGGGSLATLLARRGTLAPGEAVTVAAPLADGLAAAHRRGLVHGDVKPANILFTAAGDPVLADFGIARPTAGPDPDRTVMGTTGYMDPEVLEGARADERSDVYALGAVCYQMLCGEPPGGDAGRRRREVPAPRALAAVVERSLARRPCDRFTDMESMAAALRAAVKDMPVPPIIPGTSHPESGDEVQVPDEASPPTRPFGPRPPRTLDPSGTPPRTPRRVRAAVAAATAVTVTAAVGLAVQLPEVIRGEPNRPRLRVCPPVTSPMKADLDGDGCPSAVAWSGNVLEVEGRRYQLGRAGDAVVLGDWDCDGRDTPALYRPGGAVFFFDAWAEDGHPLPAASGGEHVKDGRPEVQQGSEGCDRLVVR
ncbi:MAG: serine/threonine protein kinase [Actinomycetota bacterium]|nr:serine/threonine protein kinase [Actinomycetota bacterium]